MTRLELHDSLLCPTQMLTHIGTQYTNIWPPEHATLGGHARADTVWRHCLFAGVLYLTHGSFEAIHAHKGSPSPLPCIQQHPPPTLQPACSTKMFQQQCISAGLPCPMVYSGSGSSSNKAHDRVSCKWQNLWQNLWHRRAAIACPSGTVSQGRACSQASSALQIHQLRRQCCDARIVARHATVLALSSFEQQLN